MQSVPVEKSSGALSLESLLLPLIERQASGCLCVFSQAVSWFIYLERGDLVYASSSIDPLGKLDRHLRRLSLQIPSLISAVRMQVRLSFEAPRSEAPRSEVPRRIDASGANAEKSDATNLIHPSRDYQAICWLVNQQYLKPAQVHGLIEGLVREVFESLLCEKIEGYEFQENCLNEFLKLHQINLKELLERFQKRLQQRQLPEVGLPVSQSAAIAAESYTISDVARQLAVRTSTMQNMGASATRLPSGLSSKSVHTIVCIDDSPTILKTINAYLDDQSFSTVLINDPVRALMQIVRCKPHLILLDINMPGLDGYELCSLLRRNRSFKTTPIIMVTSNSGLIDRARAKLVGASGYLTKPFSQSDLVKTVFKHLS
ncbi:MAG: response regulator [Drouetiella hepatica Uher 2000/2452]|jgi:twitching motility two-component system response regulator PilG|uniref:Response regulator n=1 Tax=Drouetiella hepatica Uher 2000/2452 TaxID=904376 RepID=A0A951Q903_9CYAN|nr:response regulator [Drouetiella hepatica Uher 2000/2452]